MARGPLTKFNKLKRQLRDAIGANDVAKVVMTVMQLGELANSQPADWKMSPRGFFEMSDLLRQMRNDGHITDSGQAQILELLRGGTGTED